MSIDLDSVLGVDFDRDYDVGFQSNEVKSQIVDVSYFCPNSHLKFLRQASLLRNICTTDEKTSEFFKVKMARGGNTNRVEGSIEGGIRAKWGDKDGPKIEGYGKAEIRDDRGNFVQGDIQVKNDGKGEAGVSGGCKKGDKK